MNNKDKPEQPEDDLIARFDKAYQKVADAGRKAAPAYWDLGDKAILLKKAVGKHGAWLPWLEENDYVVRTTQKAMRVRRNFSTDKGGRAELVRLGLTVEEAEQYGQEPRGKPKTKWSKLVTEAKTAVPSNDETTAWEAFLAAIPDPDRAAIVALAMVRTYSIGNT